MGVWVKEPIDFPVDEDEHWMWVARLLERSDE